MRELTHEEMAMVTGGSIAIETSNSLFPLFGSQSTTSSGSGGDSGIPTITITAPSRGGGGGGGGSYGQRFGQCFADNWRNDLRNSVEWGLGVGGLGGLFVGNLGVPGLGGFPGLVAGSALGGATGAIYSPIHTAYECALHPNG